MTWFERLRGRLRNGWVTLGNAFTRSGFLYRNEDLASNETIFAAISMLSGAMASLPVTLRQLSERVDAESHPVARMLEYGPNSNMTMFQFMRSLEVLRDSTGAGYAIAELNALGRPLHLWQLKSEYVTPILERDSRELYYHIRDPDDGSECFLHNTLVLAVNHISSDGITPINPIEVLRSSLNYDREVKEFSVDQMQNGLRAKLVVSLKGKLGEEEIEKYNGMIQRFKKHGILYMDNGKSVTPIQGSNSGTSIIDPKVFEVEEITVARVARVYSIPLEKFLPQKSSYSKAEQADLNYLRDTILPIVRMYEQEFTRVLLTERERATGMRIKFSLNGFARADMETRGKFYMQGIRSGWFCLDDVRDLEDLPPLPDGQGQEHYISKDLIPVRLLERLYPEKGAKANDE